MKKAKPIKEQDEENLPFSFIKKEVDSEKIKQHWQKIKEKIESGLAGPKDEQENN